MALSLSDLLRRMLEMNGSDLHITTNSPPQIRVHGHLVPLDLPQLTPAETKQLAYSVMTDSQKHRFEENLELDFSFGLKGLARFRANVFNQRGASACVFRLIPFEIKSFHQLGLPPVVSKMCDKPRGLVLVTGPTGSGKSTTLAAMIDKINTERHEHILTIEDPIEFVHMNKNCVVNQRELHSDTKSFTDALRAALREDPDVVLIGEMRDLETIESALRIAETGHLTFGTLHTNSASSTINRVIDVFPAHQQSQIRAQLSLVLEGIMCQSLLPKIDGKGRAMCMEILVPNAAVRNLIREDKIHQIYSSMQSGQEKFGMQTYGARRHHVSKPAAPRRQQGTRHVHGDPGAQCRRAQPDPRRQDSPDLLLHAVRPGEVRNADFQPVARQRLFPEADHHGNGADALQQSGRTAGNDRARRHPCEPGRCGSDGQGSRARETMTSKGYCSKMARGREEMRTGCMSRFSEGQGFTDYGKTRVETGLAPSRTAQESWFTQVWNGHDFAVPLRAAKNSGLAPEGQASSPQKYG